ncbi:tenascin-like protein [Phytophthora cinnamomi]|uniref:tenascin-like protein n=1 Tax=Phytophthora cinnamomi TaxID=4785 RepID=UPI0035594A5F|nr:tenascin-like protein [Phytophthora cinnamomi]
MPGSRPRLLLAALALCCCLQANVRGSCPSNCNRHGTCASDNTCTCFPGYTGYDCNDRACPKASPWVDFATGDNSVRSVAEECSNRGRCNRGNGRCECDAGFAGVACERLQACRTNCNGHGKCMSMRAMAAAKNDYNLFYSATYDTPWDADRIYGCVCDHGYTGVDCSLRQCPYGDDPISTGQVDEMQSVSCLCNGCTGTFTLSFRGETTRPLDGSVDTAVTLKAALEDLLTIRGVSVTLNGGTTLCDSDGVSALVTFTYEHGNVPALVATSSLSGGTSSLTVETDGAQAMYGPTPPLTVTGTKEWLECSGRGNCNTLIGVCTCGADFGPSDGLGNSGNILDCGYYGGSGLAICAGISGSVARCYNHGSPNAPLGVRGWRKQRQTTSPITQLFRAQMWVSALAQVLVAAFSVLKELHAIECRVRSVTQPSAATAELGCYCDKVQLDSGKSVRYSGYSCSKIPCPSGDDPWTPNQADEVQTISCSADGGTFMLSFRGETTLPLPFSAPPATVKSALERLLTITSVGVAYSAGTSACTSAGNDLPTLIISATALTHSTATVTTNVVQTVQGTKEDVVCNNRGRCDEDTGTCVCSLYHASSNALGDFGVLNDCGAVDAFMTHGEL